VFGVGQFRALFAARLVSAAGDQLARLALSMLMFDRAHSPAWTALISNQPVRLPAGRPTHPATRPRVGRPVERAAAAAIRRYFATHGDEIPRTVHSEKQIQVHIAPGITVDGRIDLIRRLDTDELAIVDFKSTDRAQPEEVTRDQLHVYAVCYQELTGEDADLIEVLDLDDAGNSTRDTLRPQET
jgi:hypothetical protein